MTTVKKTKSLQTHKQAMLDKKKTIDKLKKDYQDLANLADALLNSEFTFGDVSKRGNMKWKRNFALKRIAKTQENFIAALRDAIQNTPAVKAKRKAERVAKCKAALAAAEAED
jgi:epoxyqueuosine reductase QueG